MLRFTTLNYYAPLFICLFVEAEGLEPSIQLCLILFYLPDGIRSHSTPRDGIEINLSSRMPRQIL